MTTTAKLPVADRIKDNARQVYKTIMANRKPTMSTPIRSLSNVDTFNSLSLRRNRYEQYKIRDYRPWVHGPGA